MRGAALALALTIGALSAACGDRLPSGLGPDTEPEPEPHSLGLIEVTLTGVGSPAGMTASARAVRPGARAVGNAAAPVALSLDPVEDGAQSGIQLDALSTGSFTHGERGADGQRYLSATFRVRNADSEGDAYVSDLVNLTFIAVANGSTLEETAITSLSLYSGDPAPNVLAPGLLPTGWVRKGFAAIEPHAPDVLQVLSEAEAAAIPVADGVVPFPYGFVARNLDGSRTLPGNPGVDQFDGRVTFAFRLPLEATAAEDPFEISVLMLATADSETRVTQSLEENTAAGRAAFHARVTELGATAATLLPGGVPPALVSSRTICSVRTAGPPGGTTASMVDLGSVDSLSPNPYALDGSGSSIATGTAFQVTFPEPIDGADPATLTVRGLQSGPAFHGEAYTGNGTVTVTTPAGAFFPGEVVELAVSGVLSCPARVTRYRVAPGPASASFAEPLHSPMDAGGSIEDVKGVDVDGDGVLDLVVAHDRGDVSTFLGNGDGSFAAPSVVQVGDPVSDMDIAIALADLDGDGLIDLASYGMEDGGPGSALRLFPGNGDGTFQASTAALEFPWDPGVDLAAGDVDGDGIPDLVLTREFVAGAMWVPGDGEGGFREPVAISMDGPAYTVALGDLNGDGFLDIAAGVLTADEVEVLVGDGHGGFQSARIAVGALPFDVEIGDLNGDGARDVVVANADGTTLSILLGDGTGGLPDQSEVSLGTDSPASIALGDLDGDGDLDVAVVLPTPGQVGVLLGNGDGTFQTPHTPHATDDFPIPVFVGDLDGDGTLDLIVGNDDDLSFTFLLNGTP